MGHLGRRRRPNFWNNIDRIDRPLSIPFLISKSLRPKVLTIGAAQQQFFDIKTLFSGTMIIWGWGAREGKTSTVLPRSARFSGRDCQDFFLLQLIPWIILPKLWRQSYQSMGAHLSSAAASLHKISVWLNEGNPWRKKMYFYEQCSPQHVRILRNGGVILVIYTAG